MELKDQIRALRKEMKLTQAELGERAGLSRVSIYQIELGKAEPTIQTIEKIAEALECDVEIMLKKR